MNDLEISNNTTFESIKRIDNEGREYWYARELQKVLNYTQWRRFNDVIEKGKMSCKYSNIGVLDHFADVGKTIPMPKGAFKHVSDYKLSRYACYLIA